MDRPLPPSSGESQAALEERLLDEALDMAPEARAEWLDALTRDAPAIAARVRSLLAELDASDGFLLPGGALEGALFEDLRHQLARDAGSPPSLAEGDAVGPYRIVERIGVGGMGEVYRARDANLGRDVAVKVLPAHLEGHQERVVRLRREARVLAALNHPNIATIYGLEPLGASTALVLELVKGPTLAERVAGGAVPVAEAVDLLRQLVDALEAAHARGVVHRDLKPANLKIAPSGRLKVLDFGIATVLRRETAPDELPDVPSLTALSLVPGAAVGTASYMSPEQVRGEKVDQRADIWAFGCVAFEMLTGTRAFTGESTADVMVGVLARDPAFEALPTATPPSLRALVAGCLQKDPDRRFASIAEARPLLEAATAAAASPAPALRRSLARAWPVVAGLLFGAAVSGVVMWGVMRPAPQPVARLTVPVPATDELITGALPAIALSPDGSTIVYRALREGTLQLFRRSLGEAEPHALAGSVNAMAPFFSPDGAWIGFDRDGVLFKVPADGGPAVRICATGGASVAASWSERGDIVFAPTNGRGLFRVSAGGGTPTALTEVDDARGERQHRFPEVLPGGRAAVFSIDRGESALIAAVRLETGQIVPLTDGRQALYAPSGHLLVVRGDTIWAAPFDPERLAMRGEPAPVLRGLDPTGAAHIAMARNGSLLYIPPLNRTPGRDVVWIDHQGRERPSGIAPNRYLRHSLSPDGTRVALVLSDVHGEDIWVHDFSTGAMTRLTFDPAVDTAPVWTPDGRAIVFRSDRERGGLFWTSADGTGRPRQLTVARGPFDTPYVVSPDGKSLLYTEFRSYTDQGIGRLDLGSRRTVMLIDNPAYAELRPALSPDGRWLAYQANESGTFEVYLRPFPNVNGGKWRVSTGGGRSPQWDPGGRQLFYFEGDSLVQVPVSIGEQPAVGSPQRLFSVKLFGERLGPLYSVAPDGSSFLVMKDDEQRDRVSMRRQLLLVQNWVSELVTLVPYSR